MIEDRAGNVNLGVISIEVMFEAERMDELSQRELDRKKDRGRWRFLEGQLMRAEGIGRKRISD